MTATNFRDLLAEAVARSFYAMPGGNLYAPTIAPVVIPDAGDHLVASFVRTRTVPWVDCPTCKGEGVEFAGDEDDIGDGCPACAGTGKATVAQLLAWGQAVAQTDPEDWIEFGDQRSAVDGYRNRILGVQP